MDLMTMIYIYIGVAVVLILLLMGGKWLAFGYQYLFGKIKHKDAMGLVFMYDLSGNIGMPKIINMNAGKYVIKDKKTKMEKEYFFTREMFQRTSTFFGLPYVILSHDDSLTTAGIYFQQNKLDDQGKPSPLFFKSEDGEVVPYLKPIKPSNTLPPDMVKASVISQNLKQILADVLFQYKTVFLIVAGIGIGIGVLLFFQYNMVSETFPLQEQLLREAIEAAKSCRLTPGVQ